MTIGRITLQAGAGALALATAAGCADNGAAGSSATTAPIPVTSETLAGIWRVEDPPVAGVLNQIGADGTFVFDMEGVLATDPYGIGTYELNGTEVIVSVTNGACSDWAFRVDEIPEDGQVLAYVFPLRMPCQRGTAMESHPIVADVSVRLGHRRARERLG